MQILIEKIKIFKRIFVRVIIDDFALDPSVDWLSNLDFCTILQKEWQTSRKIRKRTKHILEHYDEIPMDVCFRVGPESVAEDIFAHKYDEWTLFTSAWPY